MVSAHMDLSKLSRDDLLKLDAKLKDLEAKKRFDQLGEYRPYEKQLQFHEFGVSFRERLLMAGNQNGKTYCGAAEAAYHLTGLYPDDWMGRRWKRPVRAWVAGVTGESTRDNPQRLLLGTQANIMAYGAGTGMIPKKCIDAGKMTLARGVSGLYDTVMVKHFTNGVFDGWSELKFKSYERGREKWQGDTLDFIWFDEEPPLDIYTEGMARITATSGMVFITFTPLQGMSEVVMRYLQPDKVKDPGWVDRARVTMTIDDALHIPAEERQKIINGYPAHEREARANGVPMLGEGKVFQYLETNIMVQPFDIPPHWWFIWGLDFGIRHPFAAALLAWDKDNDVIYVTRCIRMSDALPLAHVAAMKPALNGRGNKIPAAWPQDGHQREEFDGKLLALAKIYKARGQNITAHHAQFDDGSNSTEAGIMEMQERFSTSRLKVFNTCSEWLDEYRLYHRKEGQIVKLNDDLLSATRTGIIARRYAKQTLAFSAPGSKGAEIRIAQGVDDDPF
jgi:phage terminase large subunit-like protein